MNAFSDFTDVIKKLITELKVFGEHLFQLRKSINQHIEAMRQHQKRNPQQSNIDPLEFEKIIAKYEPPIRDKSKNDDRNYRVQRLIMIATWCAFFAALIYASLAWMQWNAAKTANDISLNAQRAWINVRVDNIEVMNGEFPHGASITFGLKVAVTFQNFGHSPALHLWPSFGNFSDIGPQKKFSLLFVRIRRLYPTILIESPKLYSLVPTFNAPIPSRTQVQTAIRLVPTISKAVLPTEAPTNPQSSTTPGFVSDFNPIRWMTGKLLRCLLILQLRRILLWIL